MINTEGTSEHRKHRVNRNIKHCKNIMDSNSSRNTTKRWTTSLCNPLENLSDMEGNQKIWSKIKIMKQNKSNKHFTFHLPTKQSINFQGTKKKK